jgi:hypothetical protein
LTTRQARPGRHHVVLWGCVAAVLLALAVAPLAAEEPRPHPEKTVVAVRAQAGTLVLDGLLDDLIWQHAPVATGFVQREPDEGQPGTQKTTFQVAYDAAALYVGVMCYDTAPDSIVALLTRRDQWTERDWVELELDPHHDHQTGFWFLVGPSGTLMDGSLHDDDKFDDTWDGVWEAEAAIHDLGWSVEYRIPYHVLRFAEEEQYSWGISLQRRVIRRSEDVRWVHVPREESGFVSRFGHLAGIRDVRPPAHLEAVPFGLGRATSGDNDELSGSAGVDVRYGITPSISLNATVNPDFGQVEADPAVLNLSVFETFRGERRPFFLEGKSIFDHPGPNIVGIGGPAQLFYSRRIGRPPSRFDLPEGSQEISRPDATTILGAAKVSGKTASRLSFGLLQAVTTAEYATIAEDIFAPQTGSESTGLRQFRVEPWTSYLVGRVQQDVRTHSTVGGTFTSVTARGLADQFVGSVDGTLKWNDNAYRIFTRLSASSNGGDGQRSSGYEAVAYLSKFAGAMGGQAYVDARSPGFKVNELGFMDRSDRVQAGGHAFYNIRNPWLLARRSEFNVNVWRNWNHDSVTLARGVNFNTWHNLKNYWNINFGISRNFAAEDDLVTRGDWVMESPASVSYWAGFGSDNRERFSFGVNGDGSRTDDGRSHSIGWGLHMNLRPASNVSLELSPSYHVERNHAQWVENYDTNADEEDDVFLFARLKNHVADLSLRAQWAFTTTLTLQGYAQSFVTSGNYRDFRRLLRPHSYAFVPYDHAGENPDFRSRSLHSNVVLRWEYRPGSTVFMIWSQSRSSSSKGPLDPDFSPLPKMLKSLTDQGDNVLLIKCSYWLGL